MTTLAMLCGGLVEPVNIAGQDHLTCLAEADETGKQGRVDDGRHADLDLGQPEGGRVVTTRRSQARASSNAPPRQYPLTAAMVTTGDRRMACMIWASWPMNAFARARSMPTNVSMFIPALNAAGPAP